MDGVGWGVCLATERPRAGLLAGFLAGAFLGAVFLACAAPSDRSRTIERDTLDLWC
jgi:hypothetical protein